MGDIFSKNHAGVQEIEQKNRVNIHNLNQPFNKTNGGDGCVVCKVRQDGRDKRQHGCSDERQQKRSFAAQFPSERSSGHLCYYITAEERRQHDSLDVWIPIEKNLLNDNGLMSSINAAVVLPREIKNRIFTAVETTD
jgi:hypothetical protein